MAASVDKKTEKMIDKVNLKSSRSEIKLFWKFTETTSELSEATI